VNYRPLIGALALPSTRPGRPRLRLRLPDPQRVAGAVLIGLVVGIMAATLHVHAAAAGSDAYAYWYGVHVWLAGGDPYQIVSSALPWHYPPWLLPAFLPWALLPWDLAWPMWQLTTVVGLLVTGAWAFHRRPVATALVAVALSVPIGIAIDTGNVVLICAFALWAAQLVGGRVGGLLWAVVTAIKWFPLGFWFVLRRDSRASGLLFLAVGIVLSLATWQWTSELVASVGLTGIPHSGSLAALRLDHLAILWAATPWLWRSALPWLQARIPPDAR
jgi:hypothetical protein